MPTLRLMTVNARAVDGGRDGLVALISAHAPDLVCVHGAPHLLRWRQAVGAIARRSGLTVAGGGGRDSGSALLLCTLGVDVLPGRDVRFTGQGGLNPAGATMTPMTWRGQEFVFAGITLVGNSAARLAQVREFEAALDGLTPADMPAVVSAVGTDRPGTASWQALAEARTPVAGRVFLDDGIAVEESRELDGHPFTAPVVVELALAGVDA